MFGSQFDYVAVVVQQFAHMHFLFLLRKDSYIQREGAQFLQEHLKGFGNARLGNIHALYNGLVSLNAAYDVV